MSVDHRLGQACRWVADHLESYVEEVVHVAEIPAPTFHEEERARHVEAQLRAAGLQSVNTDEVGNVLARLPGRQPGPALLLAAHLDTVFPAGTDCTVRRQSDVLRGPGVGDNASNLVGMLFVARALCAADVNLEWPLIVAATVGEEGLGDLRGMKAVVGALRGEIGAVLVIDGGLGGLVHQGVGSRRLRVVLRANGGHSWSSFGAPSAVHSLGRMIARIASLEVPREPRTTFNVGVIRGGTSVNTIAAEAEMLVDLRSTERRPLLQLEGRVREIVQNGAREDGVEQRAEVIGDRPSGAIPADHPLCQTVRRVHRQLGVQTYSAPSSTDANVPLSLGIPAVTIGVTTGGNGHRTDEFIHVSPAVAGMTQLLLVIGELQDPARFEEVTRGQAARAP